MTWLSGRKIQLLIRHKLQLISANTKSDKHWVSNNVNRQVAHLFAEPSICIVQTFVAQQTVVNNPNKSQDKFSNEFHFWAFVALFLWRCISYQPSMNCLVFFFPGKWVEVILLFTFYLLDPGFTSHVGCRMTPLLPVLWHESCVFRTILQIWNTAYWWALLAV